MPQCHLQGLCGILVLPEDSESCLSPCCCSEGAADMATRLSLACLPARAKQGIVLSMLVCGRTPRDADNAENGGKAAQAALKRPPKTALFARARDGESSPRLGDMEATTPPGNRLKSSGRSCLRQK